MEQATLQDAPSTSGRLAPAAPRMAIPRRKRGISLVARGEPMVWLTGGVVALAIIMIVSLLAFIAMRGFATFWPAPLTEVTYRLPASGATTQPSAAPTRTILGEPSRSEEYRPPGAKPGVLASRTLYRTGNADLTGERFVWVDDDAVVDTKLPADAVLIERDTAGGVAKQGWGVAVGFVDAVIVGDKLFTGEAAWAQFEAQHDAVREKTEEYLDLTKHEIGGINDELEEIRIELKGVEFDHGRESAEFREKLKEVEPRLAELDAKQKELAGRQVKLGAEVSQVRMYVRSAEGKYISLEQGKHHVSVRPTTLTAPATTQPAEPPSATVRLQDVAEGSTVKTEKLGDSEHKVVQFHAAEQRPRIELVDASGKVVETVPLWPRSRLMVTDGQKVTANTTLTEQADPMLVGQVVRAFKPNQQGTGDKLGTYFSRWGEFLFDDPRSSNMEGGVWPAIVGTVLMTFIMIICVVPIGVIAAIYLREYAKQGLLVTIIRISVNNLAGVPSIVFGVFGLAFFCYFFGKYIDQGAEAPVTQGTWTLLAFITGAIVIGALVLSFMSAKTSRMDNPLIPTSLKWGGIILWVIAAATVAFMIFSIPGEWYRGFYWVKAKEGQPTLGKSAMIWASLTLALLTLPVVIVATEEALSAVPRSMREGSYACGASKWQTIRRIVLPRALPGIMTGMILAVARGAGEVAPIMLVGAVKSAEKLPIAADFPWFGSNRSFMHLGFHIYDVGFQSTDSEAARPLVFTTTFLLIAIVLLLNFAAMMIRSRLRKAHSGGAF